jgi:hypothetical protein
MFGSGRPLVPGVSADLATSDRFTIYRFVIPAPLGCGRACGDLFTTPRDALL